MTKRFFLLAALAGVWSVSAQNGTLHLRLVDRITREPVVGAVAELRSQADTARTPFYASSDIDGAALLQRVPAGAWRLRVTSLGYEALERELRTSGGKTDLGTLEMSPGAEAIESVVLEVPALRSSIRGDTLSYRASAYKVTFGADAGALIGKMPGLEVADGVIEAQGRTVQRVFVDGREFFGNDVMSAVRNIPADMVESIDVYNSQGDQSEFTGVDIGDGYTAINIVTQPDKRRGAFGRLFAGYGIPDKYIGGGNINIFDRARRLSVIALVNNVNMQNFSSEDILGTTEQGQANARSGSGNFMVRPLDGVSTVQAVGANYSDEWGEKAKITASYFFNRADNRNESLTDRQTFTSSEKLVLYDGATDARIENVNHRFNSRFDYKFNNRHSLMMRTAFSVQDYLLDNETFSRTDNKFADDDIRFVNRRRNFAHNDNFGYNVSNNLIYRYRLPGSKLRSLTFGVGGRYSGGEQFSLPRQYTFRDPDDIEADTTDYDARNISRTNREQPGYYVSGNAAYTHAFGRRSRMSADYRVTYAANRVNRRTVLFDNKTGMFGPEPDPRQSTDYDYDYLTQRAGLSYQYLFKKTKVAASVYYQHVDFGGDYTLPVPDRTSASFDNITYNVVGNIHFDRSNLLKIDASSRTRNPRAADLQSIVNTTNRQHVFAGNPGLKPVYTHDLSAQYIRSNAAKGRTFTLAVRFSASPNTIADSLVIDSPHFVIVIDGDGTELGEGNQFVRPVNLPGYWNLRTTLSYGFPVRWLRSNLNVRAGVTTGRIPSVINGTRNRLNGDSYDAGLTLGSNISESVDFKIGYTGYYNVSRNSSQIRTVDNVYVSQYLTADLNFVVRQRIVLRGSADYNYYKGITDTFREERLICNLQVGCKLFRRRLGEVTVGVNDLFDQNDTTFRRTVTGTYIRNVSNLGLGRYFLAQFSYNLRLFPRQGAAVTRILQQGVE